MKLVILARDGVINLKKEGGVISADCWEAIPGSLEAIARLNHADYRVAVVTNQPGLASGALDLDRLNDIHNKLQRQLTRVGGHVDGIFFCPHSPESDCPCRLPKPGLLLQVLERFDVDADDCRLIAEDSNEIDAAVQCQIPAILIHSGHADSINLKLQGQIPIFNTLPQAVESILAED